MSRPASTVDFSDPQLPLPVLRNELLRLKALAPEVGQLSMANIPAFLAYQKAMAEAAPRLLHEVHNSSVVLQRICEDENMDFSTSPTAPDVDYPSWEQGYKAAVAVVLKRFITEYVK
jgi:hypothetical protein